jgi:hypothetical protein
MRVTRADQVRIDERTDVREVIDAEVDAECLEELTWRVEHGQAHLDPGLMGWWPYTHTLTLADGTTYHATVEN